MVPVPDSGVPAAIGYARGCGLPFELGIIRNHYVGRTFIQPTQAIRELGVRMKHNPNRAVVAGKRVVLIDDSIVRGTTSVKIVRMMREAGAREVHFRISSPPIAYPDFYGIDTPERDKLLAARMDLEAMRAFMGADSLAFLSVDGHLPGDGIRRARPPAAAVHRSLLHRRLPDPAHRPGRRAGRRTPAAARRGGLKLRALDGNWRRLKGSHGRAWSHPLSLPGNDRPAGRLWRPVLPSVDAANLHSSVISGRDTEGSPSQGAAPMSAVTDVSMPGAAPPASGKPHLDHPMDIRLALGILAVLAGGLFYMAYSIHSDIAESGGGPTTILPFLLLGVALLIALGFEFVNGFHDTANAVATVIYTHSLPAQFAVVWSGCWNLIGVLVSSGAVAFGIVSLLPVELILQVGSGAGFAMVFALLDRGDHLEPGHLVFRHPGLQLAHADRLDRRRRRHQRAAARPGRHLRRRLGPGDQDRRGAAVLAALRLLPLRAAAPADEGDRARAGAVQGARGPQPPPPWIRGLLVLTCTLVSFFHGSNDGQKGMGLIMLILIGVAPTAYALESRAAGWAYATPSSPLRRAPRRWSRRMAPATTSSATRALR